MSDQSTSHDASGRAHGGGVMFAALALFAAIALVVARQPVLGAIAGALAAAAAILAFLPMRRVQDPVPTERNIEREAEVAHSPAIAPAEYRIPPTLDADAILHSLADAVAPVAPAVAAHLWLEDPSSATLRLVASVGPMSPAPQPISIDDAILGKSVRDGSAALAPLARVQSGGVERVIWRFATPLSPGNARGVVGVDISVTVDPDGMQLARLTAPLRGAIAGSLALHVAKVETEMATALIEVARDLSRRLDPDEVLSSALNTAMRISEAATGSIMLTDASTGRLTIAKAQGLPSEVVRDTSLAEGEGIAGWVLATGQPLLIEDLPARPKSGRRHGIRSAVSVPIADSDGTLGVINVGSRGFPARFTESHMRALETLGKQTAVALRNANAVTASRELYFDTLKALALALETKDPYSGGGTERVLSYATAMGDAFGLPGDQREALRVAALLHDIGMAATGEPVGSLQRPLSTVEHGLLKLHPQIAAEILQELPALRAVVPIVYHHHEWFDGHGYGGGLSGESIPLGARILAVADAYVAMTSERPYRHAMSQQQAVAELTDKAGAQFDPAVVAVLKDLLSTGGDRAPERQRR
ncbi:MAG: HD domain-containing protein [Actinobacteria bacterium]|nr:MAG: HD domain-containing protein [Actinomycetota bacterium]